jgi:hypothetical protein
MHPIALCATAGGHRSHTPYLDALALGAAPTRRSRRHQETPLSLHRRPPQVRVALPPAHLAARPPRARESLDKERTTDADGGCEQNFLQPRSEGPSSAQRHDRATMTMPVCFFLSISPEAEAEGEHDAWPRGRSVHFI